MSQRTLRVSCDEAEQGCSGGATEQVGEQAADMDWRARRVYYNHDDKAPVLREPSPTGNIACRPAPVAGPKTTSTLFSPHPRTRQLSRPEAMNAAEGIGAPGKRRAPKDGTAPARSEENTVSSWTIRRRQRLDRTAVIFCPDRGKTGRRHAVDEAQPKSVEGAGGLPKRKYLGPVPRSADPFCRTPP